MSKEDIKIYKIHYRYKDEDNKIMDNIYSKYFSSLDKAIKYCKDDFEKLAWHDSMEIIHNKINIYTTQREPNKEINVGKIFYNIYQIKIDEE